MKKDFRYILKPKLERLMQKNNSTKHFRPKSSRQRYKKRKQVNISQSTMRQDQIEQGNSFQKIQFDPSNTIFSPGHKKRQKKKYKNDYFTRTLNRSPEMADQFNTIYSQDYDKSYKYVKPAQSFFQNKFQQRPDSQNSQGSNREARLRGFSGRRYNTSKVEGPTKSFKNYLYQPVHYSPQDQFNKVDKPLCNSNIFYVKPQIQYRHPKRIRKHRETMSLARGDHQERLVFKHRVGVLENQGAIKKPKRTCSNQSISYIEMQYRDQNPQECTPKLKIKQKKGGKQGKTQKAQTQQQKKRKKFTEDDYDDESVVNDRIENNAQFTEEDQVGKSHKNIFCDNKKYFNQLTSNKINYNPLFDLTTKNSPWNSMKLRYNNLKTQYGQEYQNKFNRDIPDPEHFRTEKVYPQQAPHFGYNCQGESVYGKNFKPKRMRTESMQWKKSRTTQKFLPESHYNENYQDYQKAYSKVEHFKHPYLATFNPSPLHVIQGKKYSNYQNEFFDKSPRKSRKTEGSDGEDEVYFQPTKAPQFQQSQENKNPNVAANANIRNHRKIRKRKASRRGRDRKPDDTIRMKLDTGANYMQNGTNYQRQHQPIEVVGRQKAFSRGKPDLNYVPIPSYNGQFASETQRIYSWKKSKKKRKKRKGDKKTQKTSRF